MHLYKQRYPNDAQSIISFFQKTEDSPTSNVY